MKLTGRIYTTKTKSLAEKALPAIKDRIERAKNVTLDELEIIEVKLPKNVPVKQSDTAVRIDFKWITDTYPPSGNINCLHISKADHDRLGLRHPNGGNLGGSYNRNIGDTTIDFFIVADTVSKIVEKFTHELSHGLSHWLGVSDMTHVYAYTLKDLDALYSRFDATTYDQKFTLVGLLKQLHDLLKKQIPTELHKRLPDPYNDRIAQDYGVEDPVYKLTGHHIGIDYACPVGTPVYAPWDGQVIKAGTHAELGNYCEFRYLFDGVIRVERYLHLREAPAVGTYKRGQRVTYSGSSGFSTGPHLHVDGWFNKVDTANINSKNWNQLTYNPHI